MYNVCVTCPAVSDATYRPRITAHTLAPPNGEGRALHYLLGSCASIFAYLETVPLDFSPEDLSVRQIRNLPSSAKAQHHPRDGGLPTPTRFTRTKKKIIQREDPPPPGDEQTSAHRPASRQEK